MKKDDGKVRSFKIAERLAELMVERDVVRDAANAKLSVLMPAVRDCYTVLKTGKYKSKQGTFIHWPITKKVIRVDALLDAICEEFKVPRYRLEYLKHMNTDTYQSSAAGFVSRIGRKKKTDKAVPPTSNADILEDFIDPDAPLMGDEGDCEEL